MQEPSVWITNFMDQSPSWEANMSSASQAISRIVWNPEVHYHIQKSPPSILIMGQINLVHAPIQLLEDLFQYWPSIYVQVFKRSLSLPFLHLKLVCISSFSHMCYMPRSCYFSWFDHPNNIWEGVQIMYIHVMQYSPIQSSLAPFKNHMCCSAPYPRKPSA
jgi:hypothetical protein